jgi:diacylglycerol kinase (ATP)
MLPLVIVNPRSAGGSTREKWAAAASDLRAHFGPFRTVFTKGPGDAIDLAKKHATEGEAFIIACGGDGTINEVANGILLSKSNCEMGIFPSGTGGDFRRTIRMPTAPREVARTLRDGETRNVDVGRVTYIDLDGNPAERYFLNESSIGLAPAIIERVKGSSSLSWLPLDNVRGRASFALSTLQEVVGLGAIPVRLKMDGGDWSVIQTVNLCIANARYFGGGMMIAPDAKLADGMFDVVNVGDINTAKIILNAYTLYRGTHTALPEVKSKLARRVEVEPANAGDRTLISIDGELPGKLPAVFEVVPSALRLRVPLRR